MCKLPRNKKNNDSENEDIGLIDPINEEHIQDENFISSKKICFAGFFYSSKELERDTANICFILDSTQISQDDSGQVRHDTTQREKGRGSPKAWIEAFIKRCKVCISQLTSNQEVKLMTILTKHKNGTGWTLNDIKVIIPSIWTHRIHLQKISKQSINYKEDQALI